MRRALPVVALAALACAQQQQQAPSPLAQLSPERAARCRVVADSVFQNVVPERLPQALPTKSTPKVALRVPRSVPAGARVRTSFLVRPDGTGDTASVVITGTDDARFRSDAIALVSRVVLAPAEIDGCPVWSQTAIVSYRTGTVRRDVTAEVPGRARRGP